MIKLKIPTRFVKRVGILAIFKSNGLQLECGGY
jgi:hypothetical protein